MLYTKLVTALILCNVEIFRSLNKLARKTPTTRDKYLQPVMFGVRTKKQLTTQHSPDYLLFGRESGYPCEVPKECEVSGIKGVWY